MLKALPLTVHEDFRWRSRQQCPYKVKLACSSYTTESVGISWGANCICPSLPVALLRVSRQMYLETSMIMYSRNKFKVDFRQRVLLTHRACLKMTSLHIRLTACSCVKGHTCQDVATYTEGEQCLICHYACKCGPELPLTLTSEKDRTLLSFWQRFCANLETCCSPILRFTLICDCDDFQTALEVVKPLQSFPQLASCSIRLGQSPDDELRQVAEATAKYLTRSRLSSFPFANLPDELQLKILSYTDLVSPVYLIWNQPSWKQEPSKVLRQFEDNRIRCCLRCTDAAEVCACPVRHAAYTTGFCECWHFPWAIFLVSKRINQLATQIFFSENNFIFGDPTLEDIDDYLPKPGYIYLSDVADFFRRPPAHFLEHLRCIRFSFRTVLESSTPRGLPDYALWEGLAKAVKQHPRLQLLYYS